MPSKTLDSVVRACLRPGRKNRRGTLHSPAVGKGKCSGAWVNIGRCTLFAVRATAARSAAGVRSSAVPSAQVAFPVDKALQTVKLQSSGLLTLDASSVSWINGMCELLCRFCSRDDRARVVMDECDPSGHVRGAALPTAGARRPAAGAAPPPPPPPGAPAGARGGVCREYVLFAAPAYLSPFA